MGTEANKDAGLQCLGIARQALAAQDLVKAEKFGLKAQKLYACDEVCAVRVR